ncbi:PspC domain-containing protein [uncultured Sphingomonas sp.]|uniref:PspC domain-containing protein n=1 Tax=uncultured Sphingomonas sp. TaxID=158754 RepID=UPI00262D08B8|nr:PspC domain-containing protein [uncultured Sphingomonas sp.]
MSADHAAPAPQKAEIFGVCRRLGDDFGFHPNILRVALAIGLVWSIEGVAFAYAAMGVIVLLSRMLAPEPGRAPVSEVNSATTYAPATEQNNAPAPPLSRAA